MVILLIIITVWSGACKRFQISKCLLTTFSFLAFKTYSFLCIVKMFKGIIHNIQCSHSNFGKILRRFQKESGVIYYHKNRNINVLCCFEYVTRIFLFSLVYYFLYLEIEISVSSFKNVLLFLVYIG